MASREVLRVVAEGITTSFRYPHLIQGVHPTFDLPPLSTLYGHICSAFGDWLPDPHNLQIGYTFLHQGKFEDFEHLHFSGTMNPFRRQMLFLPHLTLYISYPDLDTLESAFYSPQYAVVLGRSQDLMTYTDIRRIELHQVAESYFEGTLLPSEIAPYISGTTVMTTLARYIDEGRQPQWEQYALLPGRGLFPPNEIIAANNLPEWVWADPSIFDHPDYPNLPRGVWLHDLIAEEKII